jgi:hypothetical protein
MAASSRYGDPRRRPPRRARKKAIRIIRKHKGRMRRKGII